MIIRARSVVTMNGPPIADGAVVIVGNKIVEVGEWNSLKGNNSREVLDLGERALLPGLINAHCHLDYTGMRGKIARQKSFAEWIRAINAEKTKLTANDYLRSINQGFAEAQRFGTTSVANLTAFPELIARIRAPIRTWWFAELIDVRDPQNAARRVEDTFSTLRSSSDGIGLAPHAPYTASAKLYQRCEELAERQNILLTTHLAESAEEMQMSTRGTGPLANFLASISPDLFEDEGITPIAHLSQFCRLDPRWLLAHVNELLESDFDLLVGKPHVVHCPRSHAYFGHTPFQFGKLKARGLNICLGTDSLASNKDLSLFAEMRQLLQANAMISPPEALAMVTVNAARALRSEDAVGRVRAGQFADLIAVPFSGRKENLFDEIIAFGEAIPWFMADGKIQQNT